MKVRKLRLENFKRFADPLELDFTDHETGLTHDLVVLIGKNGSGKTSVLQAIAAVLGTACGRLKNPDKLDWPGFDIDLIDRNQQHPANIEITIEFSDEERVETLKCFQALQRLEHADKFMKPPGDHEEICLSFDTLRKKVFAKEGAQALFQFKGRSYASNLVKFQGYDAFKKVGTTFWYTEQRNALSLSPLEEGNPNEAPRTLSISLLRERLTNWHTLKLLNRDKRKRLEHLEKAYQMIFPNRSFVGPRDRGVVGQIDGDLYMLSDSVKEYEISELSGAEKAIFPLIFDFVSWDINASVVLIDELELHCHPPIQQTLLNALDHLGVNNQFIITTHSDHICKLIPDAAVYRIG